MQEYYPQINTADHALREAIRRIYTQHYSLTAQHDDLAAKVNKLATAPPPALTVTPPTNINSALGQASQPQIPYVTKGAINPDASDPQSQDGSLHFNSADGKIYRFDAATEPGSWVATTTSVTTTSTGGYLLLPVPITLAGLNVNQVVAVANDVHCWRFFIGAPLAVIRIVAYLGTASAGGFCGFGVYSADGNARILTSGAVSTTAGGVKSIAASATIGPGWYILATTHDNVVSALRSVNNDATADIVLNDTTVQKGVAANASVAGVLPATLGALTGSTAIGTAYIKLQS